MEWPEVTVLVCTYERHEELAKTLNALVALLAYPPEKLQWVIADDSSPSNFASKLARGKGFREFNMQVVKTDHNSGWSVNVNNGLSAVKTEYVYFTEDDYVLSKPLDLRVGIALLETKKHIGLLRYRGTGGDHVVLHQLDADLTGIMPDHQDGVGLPGHIAYCLLDSGSPSAYLYSHGPHLKRKSFHDFYGLYPEGLKLGETEEKYAMSVKDKMKEGGAPALAILPEWIPLWFDHIGRSWQHSEADKGT